MVPKKLTSQFIFIHNNLPSRFIGNLITEVINEIDDQITENEKDVINFLKQHYRLFYILYSTFRHNFYQHIDFNYLLGNLPTLSSNYVVSNRLAVFLSDRQRCKLYS